MGACVGITNTGPRGPMLPDSAGDRVDDTYFECTEREMMELEHQRHRNKKEDQKKKLNNLAPIFNILAFCSELIYRGFLIFVTNSHTTKNHLIIIDI